MSLKSDRLEVGLSISVNDGVISPIYEDFIFTKFHENKTLAKVSEFTVIVTNPTFNWIV